MTGSGARRNALLKRPPASELDPPCAPRLRAPNRRIRQKSSARPVAVGSLFVDLHFVELPFPDSPFRQRSIPRSPAEANRRPATTIEHHGRSMGILFDFETQGARMLNGEGAERMEGLRESLR